MGLRYILQCFENAMQQVLTEKTYIFMLIHTEKKIIANYRNCMRYSYHGCKKNLKKKCSTVPKKTRVKRRRKQTSVQRIVLNLLATENGVRWVPRHIPAVLEGSATMGVVPVARTRRCWSLWQGDREW